MTFWVVTKYFHFYLSKKRLRSSTTERKHNNMVIMQLGCVKWSLIKVQLGRLFMLCTFHIYEYEWSPCCQLNQRIVTVHVNLSDSKMSSVNPSSCCCQQNCSCLGCVQLSFQCCIDDAPSPAPPPFISSVHQIQPLIVIQGPGLVILFDILLHVSSIHPSGIKDVTPGRAFIGNQFMDRSSISILA